MRHRVMLLDRRSLPRPGTRDTACLWSMRRPRRLRWLVSCRTGLGGNQLNRLVGQRTASLNDISEDSIRRGRVQMSAFRLGTVEGRSLAGHTLHVTDLLSQIRIIRRIRSHRGADGLRVRRGTVSFPTIIEATLITATYLLVLVSLTRYAIIGI